MIDAHDKDSVSAPVSDNCTQAARGDTRGVEEPTGSEQEIAEPYQPFKGREERKIDVSELAYS